MIGGIRLALLAIAALSAAALCGAAPARAAPEVGKPAPDFRLTTLDGDKITLADLRGQVVVLNFWATWCVPCKKELPLLDTYYAINARHGLKVFAVTTEDSAPLYQLKPVAALLHFPMVRRLHGPYKPLGGVPTSYIIDRSGVLRYAKSGAFTLDDLNDLLVPLLNEPPPAP